MKIRLKLGALAGAISGANISVRAYTQSFDLVVVGVSTSSGNVIDGALGADWAALTKPVRFHSSFAVRSLYGRTGMFSGSGAVTLTLASPADTNAADSAAPDFDGRANLFEYATGTEPRVADSGPAAVLGQADGKLTLTFTRIADAALTYTVRGSSDLASAWMETPVFTSTGAANLAATVTAIDSVTVSTQPRRFPRLAVSD